ncbi:MAG: DUF1186 domain-containing protein [Thiohalocapsa sp.]
MFYRFLGCESRNGRHRRLNAERNAVAQTLGSVHESWTLSPHNPSAILLAESTIEREIVVDYFRSLFQGRLQRASGDVWGSLVSVATDIYPAELMDEIEQAYERDLVDPFYISLRSVRDQLARQQREVLQELSEQTGFINDTIAEMQLWACFREADPIAQSAHPVRPQPFFRGIKVGRNDPCPCGSGKKYKKCCLN